jgi:hypothetical protein
MANQVLPPSSTKQVLFVVPVGDRSTVATAIKGSLREHWSEAKGMGCLAIILGCLSLLIPIIGPFICLACFLTPVVFLFSRRATFFLGPCPTCATMLRINSTELGATCPACLSRIVVRG